MTLRGVSSQSGLIRLEGSTFRMGSDDHYPEESPVHRVTVDSFWMSATTVTNEQFSDTGYVTVAERPLDPADYPGAPAENLAPGPLVFRPPPSPVVHVAFEDSEAYAAWAGQALPTEADGFAGTAPVGLFPANDFSLFDMAGNVWEWTTDWYVDRHPEDANKACCVPQNPRRVIKGGSFLCADEYCMRYRPAARRPQMVDAGMSHSGFRTVLRDT